MAVAAVVSAVMAACAGSGATSETAAFSVEPVLQTDRSLAPSPLLTIDLLVASAAIDGLQSHRVAVSDPVYKRHKVYEGPLLVDVVRRLAPAVQPVPDGAYLVLVCLDGYRASLPLATAARYNGVLARRDVEAAGSAWLTLPDGSGNATPAPSYLVWEPASDDGALPWPYGVSAIEIWVTDPLERARPVDATEVVRAGFKLYADNCSRCHRVNGAGGTLSSELNVPANVTEYWNPAALRAFIRQPSSVRAGASMPAFERFTESELDQIVGYLGAMKYRKLPPGSKQGR